MAIKPRDNEAFYREVDEELRRDQALQVWQRWRWWMLGGAALLIAAVAGFMWWQNQREARAAEQGETLVAALDSLEKGTIGSAGPQVAQLEQSGVDGYRAAGLFSRANILIESGNVAGAVAVLKGIAADEGLAEPYRHAALVRQTALEFDRMRPEAIIARLRPLVRRGHPWLGSAGELTAHAHLRQQRPDLAAQVFAGIARDETVPESIRSRAVQMAGALGVDAIQQTPATGGAQQPGTAPAAAPAAAPAPATKE
ncbi:MAG TPA: tetratricopeptide repeat protein [Allosphingosinicella sp.]|nr:tetratricopeptide repeat protein [Allosphingosinicella sp.]